jgi:cell division transport system permease protein
MTVGMLSRFMRQSLTNVMDNRTVHAIGLGTMVVSLLIFGSFLLLFVNLDNWIQGWGHSLSMSVYLKEGVTEAKRAGISTAIKAVPGAEIKRFVSKEDAMKELRSALGSQAGLLEGLSKNPLPASYEVVFKNSEGKKADPQELKRWLEAVDGVEEVQYSEEWLDRFEGVMDMVTLVGFVIGSLLCMGVLFIVTNTIKLTIYSRKEEIEILKLVGATDWFVKMPFLLEGMIQGLLSGILAVLILYAGHLALSAKKMHLLGPAVLDFVFLPPGYAAALCLISTLLGLVGSFIAVGRFFEP